MRNYQLSQKPILNWFLPAKVFHEFPSDNKIQLPVMISLIVCCRFLNPGIYLSEAKTRSITEQSSNSEIGGFVIHRESAIRRPTKSKDLKSLRWD